ncbi:MAG TPA: MFS transporter [Casimicrobiaceae bacterium]|nr:MFS transporter [Casimicrobiaceae bacterium]
MSDHGARGSRTFAALIGLGILNHTVLAGSRVTVSLYALSQDASPFVVGALMGLYSFLPMWFAVGAGRLSDRIGVRRPMLIGSCGIALGAALPWLFPGLPALFVTTALIGISFMLFQVATQNATGAFGLPSDRAKNFSLLALGYSVSGFSGPLIAGLLIDHASFGTTFLTLAVLPLVPVAVFGYGALALPQLHSAHATPTPGGVVALFRNPHLRRVFVVNGLLSMAWDLHTFFIPIYGARLGLSASVIGIILAAFAAATFVVRLGMPWIARRFAELQVLTAALFVAAAAYSLFPLVGSVSPLIALSFTLGLALGSAQPMVMSLLHSIVPAGRMGEAVGVRMSIINASTFAVPLLFGAIGSSVGIGPVFWLVGGALAGGGFFARRR